MVRGKKLAVVVPAFNEEKLIAKVIQTMPKTVDKIVVVDDASKDDTVNIVKSLMKKNSDRLILITHKINQGVGGAIATGYKWCRDHRMDITVVMAGDNQMDPRDMPALIEPIVKDEVDYTKGNRLISGEAWKIIPRVRYLGNSAMSFFTKIASGYWHITDSQSGFTAVNLKVLQTLDLDSIFKRYGMPNDMLVKLNIYNFRVRDVPVRPIYGIGEKSGIKPLRMIPRLGWFMFKLYLYRMVQKYVIRDFHPLVLFYFTSFALLFFFFPILLIRIVIIWIISGAIPSLNALASVMVVLAGIQLLLFAMLFDMEANHDLK
jgi:glycosyltransferase involved in cell wall biosynthesis